MTSKNYEEQAEECFFMREPKHFSLDEIDASRIDEEEMQLAFSVFKDTLREIVFAVQAFFNMTLSATLESRFERMLMANMLRIRAEFYRKNKEPGENEIQDEARLRTLEEMDNADFKVAALEETARRLLELSAHTPDVVSNSNNAILRQSSVMLWSGTENLLREYFRITINRHPNFAQKLFTSDEAKRYWSSKDLTIDVIHSAGFNLQNCMGDTLLEMNSMISLKSIKAGYTVICPNDNLLKILKSKSTYNLFALRNLVAHRNGVVDAQFLSETSYLAEVGEKIIVTPSHFDELYMAAKNIGIELFKYAQPTETN